jgi:outer membrane protein TolC
VPLLNWSELDADLAVAKSTRAQATQAYRGVVQRAFAEVSSSLSAIEQATQVVALRQRRQAVLAATVETADALFRAGKASYLEVLLAQQSSLEAEIELIEALRDGHVARIRLYKALGGGWQDRSAARGEQ